MAMCSNLMYLVSLLLIILYIKCKNPAPGSLFWLNQDSRKELKDLFKYEVVVGTMVWVEWTSVEIVGLLAGLLQPDALAGITIINAFTSLVYSLPLSFQTTVLSYMGIAIGEKDINKAKKFLKAGNWLAIGTALYVEILLIMFSNRVLSFYTADPLITHDARNILIVFMVGYPVDFIQTVMASGLRALGKEKIGSLIVLLCNCVIGVPIAYLVGYKFGFGAAGLAVGPVVAGWVKYVIFNRILKNLNWELQTEKVIGKLKSDERKLRERKYIVDEEEMITDPDSK